MFRRRLVIETATAACSVALIDEVGERVIACAHEVVGRGHAERLIPLVADLIGSEPPDAIAADCGPGSFTGLRVGLAAARALALAWNVPAHGFSSLALIAAGEEGGDLAVAIAGGHGELFVQRYAGRPAHAAGALASLTPAAAAGEVTERLVIGSGARALVEARGHGEARERLPDAADWLRLTASARSLPLQAIYGRQPDAVPGGGR